MRRITPQMVVDAFVRTGLAPTRGHYFSLGFGVYPCACALGAVALSRREDLLGALIGADERPSRSELGAVLDNEVDQAAPGRYYRDGFTSGFDGGKVDEEAARLPSPSDERRAYFTGRRDGRAAARAVLPPEEIK